MRHPIFFVGMLFGAMVFFGCSPPSTLADANPSETIGQINTPTALPTFLTPYVIPTQTQTATLTLYPTFDASNFVTSTPFPSAECPPEDPNFEIIYSFDPDTMGTDDLVDFARTALEDGASLKQVAEEFGFDLLDVTGDGVTELIISDFYLLEIIGCVNGKVETILEYWDTSSWVGGPQILFVQDMNLNGVPDIVTKSVQTTGGNSAVQVFEWNGTEFVSLIKGDHGFHSQETSRLARALYWYEGDWIIEPSSFTEFPDEILSITSPAMNGGASINIRDINGNGIKELILNDNGPGHWDTFYNFGPWRGKEVIFEWNGQAFLYSSLEMDLAEYRYQAVQDADRYFLLGEYDKALELYQQVIFDNELEWWSPERMDFIRDTFYASLGDAATPTPVFPDPNETPSLEAYARYRIVLHYLSGGFSSDAQIVYEALLEKFPAGSVGYLYAEMATLLINAYEGPDSLAGACADVVNYVRDYPEVLEPLGSSDHGLQGHNYEHIDVCPFADPLLSPPI